MRKLRILVCILAISVLPLLWIRSEVGHHASPLPKKSGCARVADPSIGFAELRKVLDVGDCAEQPSFWTAIVNDTTFDGDHRRLCLFRLCELYAHKGIRLSSFSALLSRPTWLKPEGVSAVGDIIGNIPVHRTMEGSVFVVHPRLPASDGSSIFLSFQRSNLTELTLYEILKGTSDSLEQSALGNAEIMEIGYYITKL